MKAAHESSPKKGKVELNEDRSKANNRNTHADQYDDDGSSNEDIHDQYNEDDIVRQLLPDLVLVQILRRILERTHLRSQRKDAQV